MMFPSLSLASVPVNSTAVVAVFVLTYLGIALGRVPGLKLDRTGIVLLGGIAIMIGSGLSPDAVISLIHWPTILLLFAFFVLSAQLRLSGFFDKVADGISARLGHPARFLAVLMAVTAGLSAFLNHDIVCFVFTPVVGLALLRRRINPVPFLVALAISSNIGAAATVVGNPQNMLISQVAQLGFGQYIAWCIVPVLLSLGSAYGLIWMLSYKHLLTDLPPPEEENSIIVEFNRAHTIKGLVIFALVIACFFTRLPKEIIALTAAGIHLASRKFRTDQLLGLVDWSILVLFMGLFVVTGAFQETGLADNVVAWLAHAGVNLNSPVILALVTAGLSNLINNSAAVTLLVNVVDLTNPVNAYVLALANSFGGSLLILGSVSNIIVVHQAKELGIDISFRDFVRLGIPVTLVAMGWMLSWVLLMGY